MTPEHVTSTWTCIKEVPRSKLDRYIDSPEIFLGFPHPFQTNVGISEIGNSYFLANCIQSFVNHPTSDDVRPAIQRRKIAMGKYEQSA
jgi:hypothetical protein